MNSFITQKKTFGQIKYSKDESVYSNKNQRILTPRSKKSSAGYSNLSGTNMD